MRTATVTDWLPLPAFGIASPAKVQEPTAAINQKPPEPTWESLDRKDWHVWILALLLLLVLGAGLLSFMFPSAFWFSEEMKIRAPQRVFLGFCVLMTLALIYMLQTYTTVRGLKRQLYLSILTTLEAEPKRLLSVLESLPQLNQFRDSLAMECRRALTSDTHLAMVLVDVSESSHGEIGQAADLLRQMLRAGESLFYLRDHVLALILPEIHLQQGTGFATHMEASLRGRCPGLEISSTVNSYPDDVNSFTELESILRCRIH